MLKNEIITENTHFPAGSSHRFRELTFVERVTIIVSLQGDDLVLNDLYYISELVHML